MHKCTSKIALPVLERKKRRSKSKTTASVLEIQNKALEGWQLGSKDGWQPLEEESVNGIQVWQTGNWSSGSSLLNQPTVGWISQIEWSVDTALQRSSMINYFTCSWSYTWCWCAIGRALDWHMITAYFSFSNLPTSTRKVFSDRCFGDDNILPGK